MKNIMWLLLGSFLAGHTALAAKFEGEWVGKGSVESNSMGQHSEAEIRVKVRLTPKTLAVEYCARFAQAFPSLEDHFGGRSAPSEVTICQRSDLDVVQDSVPGPSALYWNNQDVGVVTPQGFWVDQFTLRNGDIKLTFLPWGAGGEGRMSFAFVSEKQTTGEFLRLHADQLAKVGSP